MLKPSIKIILVSASVTISLFASNALLFAQNPQEDTNYNRGYITASSPIPEAKKNPAALSSSDSRGSAPYASENEENLTELQRQARQYRTQGLEFQRMGDLEKAMNLYQKAVEIDPTYAVAYNDLGIVYEANKMIDRAEDSYLRSIKINPYFLSGYSNLALLYENKRDLDKAAFYWEKRAELGSVDDPWTMRARQRLEDIRLVLGRKALDTKEQNIMSLTNDVMTTKALLRKDNKALAKHYFAKAKLSFQKGDEAAALKQAVDAYQLDSSNSEIEEFIDKVQRRLLSK